MSTSHFYLKELGNGGGHGRAAFETRDFYLACFLRCSGYNLIDCGLRGSGRSSCFVTARAGVTTCWRSTVMLLSFHRSRSHPPSRT